MPFFKFGFNINLKTLSKQKTVLLKHFIKKHINESKETQRTGKVLTVKDIPGPKPSLPFVGTGWQYWRYIGSYDIHKIHEVLFEKFEKYGPIFKEEYQRNKVIVYISDPKDIETMFRFQGKCPIRPTNEFVIQYRNENKHKYSSVGIANLNGIEWYEKRQLLAPALMSMDVIKHFIPNLDQISKDFVQYFRKQIVIENNDEVIQDFRDISYNFVLESITSWCLDTRLGCLSSDSSLTSDGLVLTEATKDLFNSYQQLFYSTKLWKYFKTKSYKKLEKSENSIYNTLSKYVDSALNQNTGAYSLMNELFKLNTFSINEIKVTLMDFIIGGLFTVSNALNFICYHLANNPIIQQKLSQEINDVMNGENGITDERLSQMPYLRACIKESFRLTSTIPGIIRVLPNDVMLSGYHIQKGTLIFANFMTTCLSDKYFSNPKAFIPERWIGKARNDFHSFSILPFGFGNRMCAGKRFAILNLQMAIISVIQNFELSVDESDGKMDLICNFLIVSNHEIKFKVKKR